MSKNKQEFFASAIAMVALLLLFSLVVLFHWIAVAFSLVLIVYIAGWAGSTLDNYLDNF